MLESHFLDDTPLTDEGESQYAIHTKVAECIVDDIVNGHDLECKRIALIGEWGSGKSTVLSFVSKRLGAISSDVSGSASTEKLYRFLTFDLWAHSGEMLQRGLLQSLHNLFDEDIQDALSKRKPPLFRRCIDSDVRGNWVEMKKAGAEWRELDDKIQHTHRVEKRSQMHLVPFFASVAVVAGIVSAVLKVLFGAYAETLSESAKEAFHLCSMLLCWTTFLTAVIALFLIVIRVALSKQDYGEPFFAALRSEVEGYLVGQPKERFVNISSEDIIGSLTFQKYLSDMMRCVGEVLGPVCVVIALDNLDRLRNTQIRDSWDSIEFLADALSPRLAHKSGVQPDDASRLVETWLLLSVSERAIWCIAEEGCTSDCITEGGGKGRIADGSVDAVSTLAKLFMYRYDIPRPTKSEWKRFVRSCLVRAFPEIGKYPDLVQFIFSAFDTIPNERSLRAPRTIISIVNEMVAYYRMYGDVEYPVRTARIEERESRRVAAIDLRSVAIFVIIKHRNSTERNERAVALEDLIAAYCAHRQQAEWLGFPQIIIDNDNQYLPLVMMAFGIDDPNVAQEVFVENRLRSADFIRDMDLVAYENSMPSLWDILLDCVSGKSSAGSIEPESERFFVLLECVLNCDSDDAGKGQVIYEMSRMAPQSDWATIKGGGRTMAKLVNWGLNDVDFATSLVASLEESSRQIETSVGSPRPAAGEEYQTWSENVFILYDALSISGMPPEAMGVHLHLGQATYKFLKDAYGCQCKDYLLETMSFSGDLATQNTVQGLVRDASNGFWAKQESFPGFVRFVGQTALFNDASAIGLFRRSTAIGLNSDVERARFFGVAWMMQRISGSIAARAYCESYDGGASALLGSVSSQYEAAAFIAACFDEDLGLIQRFADWGDKLLLDGSRYLDEGVKIFAFSPTSKGNRYYIDCVFDRAGDNSNRLLRAKVAEIILENAEAEGLSKEDIEHYRSLLLRGTVVGN